MTNRKFFSGAIALLAMSLTACTTNETVESAATTPTKSDPKILAECALLNEAMIKSAKQPGIYNTQIVRGCPGYENLPDNTTTAQGAGQFISASSAPVPQQALDMGRMGKIIFQRMIARGVSPDIATQMVGTDLFAQAVAAHN